METKIIPLIAFENGKYTIGEEASKWLSHQTKPFATLCCAGKYRTGKSFLLNRITNAKPGQGFGVGETVQACTKGIWISKTMLETSTDMDVLVMDTEGIDALDAEQSHDTRIFTLAILLSSMFIYNSVGHIDETSVQTLSFMSKVAEFLDKDATKPDFYWVLRDFSLEMVGKNGKPIENREYLEEALCETMETKDSTRSCIKNIFPNRQLFTLPRPSKTDSSQKLDINQKNLNPKFMTSMGEMRESILNNAKPICANRKPMTGSMFLTLCKHLIEKIQDDKMPVMKDAWSLVREIQHNDAYRELMELISERINSVKPDTEKNLMETAAALETEFEDLFIEKAMAPHHSPVFLLFLEKIKQHTLKMVEEKKLNMEEVVQNIVSKIEETNEGLSFNNILQECNDFVTTYDSSMFVHTLFPEVLKLINSEFVKTRKESYEKGQSDVNTNLEFSIEEMKLKYEDVVERLEQEQEYNLTLQPKETIVVTEKPCMVDSFTTMDDDFIFEKPNTDTNETEMEDFFDQLRSMSETKENIEKELDFYKQGYNECKQQLEDLSNNVQKNISDLERKSKDHCEKVNKELLKEKRERERLEIDITILDSSKTQLETSYKVLQEKFDSIQNKTIDIQKSTLEEFRKKDLDFRSDLEKGKQDLAELNRKLSEEKQSSTFHQAECNHLKRQLEDYNETKQELKKIRCELIDKKTENARMETDLKNIKVTIEKKDGECDRLKRSNLTLENKVAVLTTEKHIYQANTTFS